MTLLTKRSLATIKDLFGHHRNLHPHLTALAEGKETAQDIDILLAELEYYIDRKAKQLDPDTLIELNEAVKHLKNN